MDTTDSKAIWAKLAVGQHEKYTKNNTEFQLIAYIAYIYIAYMLIL